jgi:hypothetical protein
LFADLTQARGEGRLARLMTTLERTNLLIIDDWGPEPLAADQRRDLLEIVDDRYDKGSLLVTSQVPVAKWHDIIADPTLGDAILDRKVHNAHRIQLKGDGPRGERGSRRSPCRRLPRRTPSDRAGSARRLFRIITRVKAAFVRLGIRSFNPKLKTAAAHLETLRTPEGEPIPPNTLAALKRDLERHRIVKQQIREIEETRLERLAQAPSNGPHAMVRLLARVIGSKRPTCWCRRCCHGTCGIGAPLRVNRLARRKRGQTA